MDERNATEPTKEKSAAEWKREIAADLAQLGILPADWVEGSVGNGSSSGNGSDPRH